MTAGLFDLRPPVSITVYGQPAPQGSKKHVGHGIMIESSKKIKPWREAVKAAGLEAMGWGERPPLDGPLEVVMVFTFARPKSHYGTGRNAGVLKPSAPSRPATIPDLSKLARGCEDSLTDAAVWKDDARIVEYSRLAKVYAGYGQDALLSPGCVITVRQI